MRPRRGLDVIREKAQWLREVIQSKYPALEVECADWVQLIERQGQGIPMPGEFELDFGADAYLWIRGDPKLTEQAATLANDLAAEAQDGPGVTIVVRTSSDIWCRKSGRLEAQVLGPGQDIRPGPTFYAEQKGGVTLFCWVTEPHQHDFGKFNADS